jgi:transposase-like protein
MGQMGEEEVRRRAVLEYERGGVTLRELGRRHGVSTSRLHRWVKQAEAAGGIDELERLEGGGKLTAKQREKLPADVKRLQKELEEALLYNELLNAMIDIAEEQMGIDIRKKSGAKQR